MENRHWLYLPCVLRSGVAAERISWRAARAAGIMERNCSCPRDGCQLARARTLSQSRDVDSPVIARTCSRALRSCSFSWPASR